MPKSSSASRTPASRSSAERPVDHLELADRQRLGQLQDQPVGGHVVAREAGEHARRGTAGRAGCAATTLTATGRSKPASRQRAAGDQRLVEHRFGEGRQLAGALHGLQEPQRVEVAVVRVVPAGQRLGAR